VAFIKDKIREARLRLFGHIKRSSMHAPANRCENIDRPQQRRVEVDQPRVAVKSLDMI